MSRSAISLKAGCQEADGKTWMGSLRVEGKSKKHGKENKILFC